MTSIAATSLSPLYLQNRLLEWHSMPGSAGLFEAFLRTDCTPGIHCSSTPISVTRNGLASTMTTGAHLTKHASVASLPACISLATTLRKVLLIHKQVPVQMHQEEPEYMQWCSKAILSYRNAVDHLVEISKLSAVTGQIGTSQNTPDPFSRAEDSASTVEAIEQRQQLLMIRSQSAFSRCGPAAHDDNTTSTQTLLQRLTDVVLLLVTSFNDMQDAVELGISYHNLLWGSTLGNQGLKNVMVEIDTASQQTTLTTKARESLISSAWEKYAISDCDSIFLNGCCNLGCTNLASVSEAVLPTQLCAGCRRMRYCSVECQQAAWLGGRHSSWCGKKAVV